MKYHIASLDVNLHKRTTGNNNGADRNAPLNDLPERMQKLKGRSFTYQQLIRK